MKAYSILIQGTGPCCDGTEQSADIALQALLKQLETRGHKFASVSMVIDGTTLPIIGPLQAHTAPVTVEAGAGDLRQPVLAELLELLKRVDETTTTTLFEHRQFVNYEKADDAPKPRASRKKKEGAADQGGGAPLNQAGAGGGTGGDPLEKVSFQESAPLPSDPPPQGVEEAGAKNEGPAESPQEEAQGAAA